MPIGKAPSAATERGFSSLLRAEQEKSVMYPRADFSARFALAQRVRFDGGLIGTVICVSFRNDSAPQYEVAWCNGDKIEEQWFHEWRLSPA